MKTSLFKILIIMAICFAFAFPAVAMPVTAQIYQQPYEVSLNGEPYTLTFHQGPFSPGPSGLAELSGSGESVTYSFMGYPSGLITVDGLCDFYFAGDELIYIESTFLTLKAQNE